MNVFFDNCTSPTLASTINGYLSERHGRAVHIRDAPCGRDAADVDWMRYLAESNDEWLVISGDRRIQKNRAERLAYRQANLKGFVLAPSYQKTPVHQQASFLIWRWPDVETFSKLAAPFMFELPMHRSSAIRVMQV